MCTLAILPTPDGYLLGHNRDESVRRGRGLPPARSVSGGTTFLAPRDPDAGGSWIAACETGITFCLLNAAHVDPGRLSARPPSRGNLIDVVAALTSPADVESALRGGSPSIEGMRGFHLVMVSPGGGAARTDPQPGGRLSQDARCVLAVRFRWDGRTLQRDEHEAPALFVSSGYDQAGAEAARGATWRAFLGGLLPLSPGRLSPSASASRPDLEALLASHEPSRGVLSICMHGDAARTVSRTIVAAGRDTITMTYRDGAPCDPSAKEYQIECPRPRSG